MHESERIRRKDELEMEIGDVFFALTNYARFLGFNPENALRRTNEKFIARFNYIEEKIKESGRTIGESNLEEMDGRQEVTKDTEMTKEEVYKDYGMFSGVKSRSKTKTRRPPKKLKQCSKCGIVGDAMTKHSLTGEHKPPFIWLCRQPCHDEVRHKNDKRRKSSTKAATTMQHTIPHKKQHCQSLYKTN